MLALRPNPNFDPDFIEHFLRSNTFLDWVGANRRGSAQPHLRTADIETAQLPLFSKTHQQKLVSKIDGLSAKSRRASDRLDHIPRLVEKYKQAILADAFKGNLTSHIRAKEGWPDWSFDLARNVCLKVQSGGTPKGGFANAGIPFLKVYNIVDQKVAFDYKPQYVSLPVHEHALRKSKTIPGDVLMNIVGPPLGKICIVPDTFPEWNINQAITLFRPSERLLSKWIYYFLCSGISVAEVTHETKGSAGQVNISLSQCRDFTFPVPSRAEQEQIIRLIEVAFAWIDRLVSETTSARKLIDHLDQAVLAKAFRGELIPQDPNDEPATVLPERIRAERHATPAPRSRKFGRVHEETINLKPTGRRRRS
jgi:type I restriction enzyme S subunit